MEKIKKHIDSLKSMWEDIVFILIFSFIFSFCTFIGFYLQTNTFLPVECIGYSILKSMLISIVTTFVYIAIIKLKTKYLYKYDKKSFEIKKDDWKVFLFYIIIIFLLWIPVFLAYYPGLFSYDCRWQIPQHKGTYSNHHPLMHTLLMQLFYYKIGGKLFDSYTTGMACYTIMQMIILATAFSYLLLFLYRFSINKKMRLILLFFIGIFPVCSVLSISITKDIIFSAFFLTACIVLAYWSIKPKLLSNKRFVILYIISIIGACLFRNNCFYGLLLMILTFLLMKNKSKEEKKIVWYTLYAIGIYILIYSGLNSITSAEDYVKSEMLSIPCQQISYVYKIKKDKLTGREVANINRLLPLVRKYDPHSSDPVKFYTRIENNSVLFLKIYIKYLIKYPYLYAEAFLQNTIGYWYVFDTSSPKVYGYGLENRQGYLLTDTHNGFNIYHTSYFTKLENLYERLFSLNEYQKLPVISIIFSIALYFWIIVCFIIYAIIKNVKNVKLIILFLSGYIATVLLGPCAIVRYAFPYMICIPILIVSVLRNKEDIEVK